MHFNNESRRQKVKVLEAFATVPLDALGVVCIGDTVSRDSKRATRVSTVIVTRLQERAVGHLVIESRQDDRADERTIHAAPRPQPRLMFEHRISAGEPMPWLADPVAWIVGAGELWLERVESVLSVVVELRP